MRVLSFDPGGRGRLRVLVMDSGCWHFIGRKTKFGHGSCRFQGKVVGAHRAVYCITNKLNLDEINGIVIRHKCDNPPCCNPNHLQAGTLADNNRDREERGRAVYLKGERNGQSKLTEKDVLEIREASGTLQEIANRYGVHLSTIHLIRSRKKWGWL